MTHTQECGTSFWSRNLHWIKLCSIRNKFLGTEKICARKHDTYSRNLRRFLVQVCGTRNVSVYHLY